MKTKPQKSLILFSGIIFLFFALSLYRCSERPTQSYKDTPIINLKIETDDFATIGDIVYLPLYLRNDVSIGGFSLLVSWDPNVLNLHDVIRGDCIDDIDFYLGPHKPHYMFERFYFELLPSTEIHKKKMKIIGLADILDEYQGYPIKPNLSGCVLTYLKFEVKNNANLRGFFLPVNFEWDNETLDDNILTDSTGQIWYVSANPVQFPQNTTIPDVEIIRSPIFMDGGIEVLTDLIIGLPGDNFFKFAKSIKVMIELKSTNIVFSILHVLPGTELYKNSKKYGLKFDDKAPHLILSTPTFPYDEIDKAVIMALSIGKEYNIKETRSFPKRR